MTETDEQKLQRFQNDYNESHNRINKLLCENDPLRNERFYDRKAKLQYNITMIQHRLNRLNEQAKPLLEKKAGLEADLKKVIADHENFEDHKLYVGTPISAMTYHPEEEIKELEQELAHYAAMSSGIRDRIARVKASVGGQPSK